MYYDKKTISSLFCQSVMGCGKNTYVELSNNVLQENLEDKYLDPENVQYHPILKLVKFVQ